MIVPKVLRGHPEQSEGSRIERLVTPVAACIASFECEVPRFARDDIAS